MALANVEADSFARQTNESIESDWPNNFSFDRVKSLAVEQIINGRQIALAHIRKNRPCFTNGEHDMTAYLLSTVRLME